MSTPFDWNKALDEAIAEPRNYAFQEQLSDMAGSWVTCACGNQCDALPRKLDGEPRDEQLSRLGVYFFADIDNGQFSKAKHTLSLIEARSAELLKSL